MFRVRSHVCLIALCLTVPATCVAQLTTADILGRVIDSSGGVLPAVIVTVENISTHDTRVVATNATGEYVVNLLPIGAYTLRIELQGFGVQSSHVMLAAGDRIRVDVELQVGDVSETIKVIAESALVQTDTATLSALITQQAVQDLPMNGRNFARLVQLVAGANDGLPDSLASGTRPDDRRQTSAISINGALDNQNNHLIDGVDNNERAIGTIVVKPSIDAIAQVKVQSSLYTAETGRTAGGVVNIITMSGTNSLRGSAFEFYRDDKFDSPNYFSTTKPLLHQNQFGGSLGGPLKTNKTFFFADVEGFRQEQGVTNVTTVPTARMRHGDFSELSVAIFDPTTTPRMPFPGNLIPSGRMDPIALRYLALYPLATAAGLANNFQSTTLRTQNSATADVRIDHRFDDRNTLFARYSYNNVATFTPSACPATTDGVEPGCSGGLAFPGPNTTKAHGLQVNYLRIFSPTLLMEIKGGFLKADIESLPLNYGKDLSEAFGLKNVNIDAVTSGLTPMTIADFATLGDSTFIPLIQLDDTRQFHGSLSKSSGPHNLRMGAGLIMRKFTVFQSASPVGEMTFNTQLTDNGTGTGGNGLASFLLGYPSTEARSHSLIYPHYHTNEPSVFVQDDWRTNSWLTVNLGVRYDVFTPFTEEANQVANLDFTTFKSIIGNSAGVKTDYSNVAPRLGFAATVPNRMVVRGGFGLAYFPGNYMSQSLLKNPPFISTFGPITSAGASGGTPTLLLKDGLPLPVATDANNLAGALIAVDQNFKSTRVQQFNVTVEKDVAGNVVSAAYVGSRASNVAVSIGNVDLAPVGAGAIQQRRTYFAQLPNVNQISLFSSTFEGTYNALQVVFQRRQRRGLTVASNYTLGHAVDTQPSPWDVSFIERADASNDIRHRFVLTASSEFPGQSLTGVARQVLAGWQLNGVLTLQSGLPFTITNQTSRTNTGGADRPNQVGDPTLSDPTIAKWFDVSAFVAQPINTAGNTGRNTLHGPSQRRLDLSLFKVVPVTATTKIQLRIECYNVTDTPSWANPNSALGSPAFGTITSTGTSIPRQMQFAAKLLF